MKTPAIRQILARGLLPPALAGGLGCLWSVAWALRECLSNDDLNQGPSTARASLLEGQLARSTPSARVPWP